MATNEDKQDLPQEHRLEDDDLHDVTGGSLCAPPQESSTPILSVR